VADSRTIVEGQSWYVCREAGRIVCSDEMMMEVMEMTDSEIVMPIKVFVATPQIDLRVWGYQKG